MHRHRGSRNSSLADIKGKLDVLSCAWAELPYRWLCSSLLRDLWPLLTGSPSSSVLTVSSSTVHQAPLYLALARALFTELCHRPSSLGVPWCLRPSILLSVLTHLGISSFFVIRLLFVCTVGWSHLCLQWVDFFLLGFGRPPPEWTGRPSQTAQYMSSFVLRVTWPSAALYLIFPSMKWRWWWGHLIRMLGGFKEMSKTTAVPGA